MIDADLVSLYETETKKIKQQVKRNTDRFPGKIEIKKLEVEPVGYKIGQKEN